MKRRIVLVSALLGALVTTSHAQPQATAGAVRATDQWNLDKSTHLAIDGYDPVAYFPEGGGKPAKGKASITLEYRGALYRFASVENKARFEANPSKYEPSYGGWCAWAMLEGDKVEVDPTSFIVQDDRLFLFYDGILADTRKKWLKGDHAAQAAKSDANWARLSGETRPALRTLKRKLDAKSAEFAKGMPPEVLSGYEKSVADIAATGVLDHAMKVGDHAPDFELPDARGGTMSLKALLAKGPVVLTWYRGGWCPFCNIQLQEYQASLEEMEGAGGQLVAISPQTPEYSLSTAEKDELKFAVVSDAGNKVAKQYGLAYKAPPSAAEMLEKGVGLAKWNGDSSLELPISATYVVAPDGTIAWAFVDTDYRNRAEPADIIAALRALQSSKK